MGDNSRQATTEHNQAKALFRKLVTRFKKRHAAAKAEIATGREQLNADREHHDRERQQFARDTEQYKHRLSDAWGLIADGQRRLLADRTAVEETLHHQHLALEARAAEVVTQEAKAAAEHDRLHAERTALQAEIAGLEARAFHLQFAVQELATQRIAAEAESALVVRENQKFNAADINAPVPLDARKDKSFDQLLAEVTHQERHLHQERQTLTKAKRELQTLATELTDQRAVLAEQFAKLAAARDVWHQTETTTVKELEDLARALNQRERVVLTREKATSHTETTLSTRDRELRAFRMKLEGWQAGLTAHESQWYAAKDALQLELDRKREHLATCEVALQELAQQWASAWKTERETLKLRYETVLKDTEGTLVALQAKAPVELAKHAAQVAAEAVALEAMKQEWLKETQSPKAEQKLRVMKKGWERHFIQLAKDLGSQQHLASTAVVRLTAKEKDLHKALVAISEKTAAIVDAKRVRDTKQWDQSKEAGAQAVTLSIEVARRERTERQVQELRAEVDRLGKVLTESATGDAEVIPLRKAA